MSLLCTVFFICKYKKNIYSFLEVSKEFFDSIHSPFYDEMYLHNEDDKNEDLENKIQMCEKLQGGVKEIIKKKKEKKENNFFLFFQYYK